MRDKEKILIFLYALGELEDRAYKLYRELSKKVKNPRASALLLYIASDSLKHTMLLKTIATEQSSVNPSDKECEKIVGDAWKTLQKTSKAIFKAKTFNEYNLPSIIDNLMAVYTYKLIQFKTLKLMSNQISELYGIDLQDMKEILELTISDEDIDTEILLKLKNLFSEGEKSENLVKPIIKYQSPDRWRMP